MGAVMRCGLYTLSCMDFGLSDEQKMILDVTREFVRKELLPLEGQVSKAEIEGRTFPDAQTYRELQLKAKSAGLWGLQTPEEYGGANVGPLLSALINMETGRALVRFNFGGSADNILYARQRGAEEALPDPDDRGRAPSAASRCPSRTRARTRRNIKTSAVKRDGSWMLNGAQDLHLERRAGRLRHRVRRDRQGKAPPRRHHRLPGRPRHGLDELAPIPTDELVVGLRSGLRQRVRAGRERPGRGRQRLRAGHAVDRRRAAHDPGAGGRLRRSACWRSGSTTPSSAQAVRPAIADYQAIQWMLADSAVEIEQVKWLTLHAAWKAGQGHDARHDASIAKLSGAQMVDGWPTACCRCTAAWATPGRCPIERVLREVRVYRIFEGTDEIQKRSIARNLIRGHAPIGVWD